MTTTIGVPAKASRRGRKLLALSVLPVFSLLTGLTWIWARFGSDLRTWSADPEYAYLLNGINIATGRAPAHVDHPGTPLQILNGVIVVVFRWMPGGGSSADSVAESVVDSPEAHLTVLAVVFAMALAVSLLAVGWRVASAVGIPLGVLAQSAPFALSAGYGWLTGEFIRNFPEAMILPVLTAAVAIIAPAVLGAVDARRDQRIALGLGVCLGTAVALKINAWPVAALLPWALINWRFALRTYLAAGLSALLWLLPVLAQGRQMLAFWFASGGGFTEIFFSLAPLRALFGISLWVPGLFMVMWTGIAVWLVLSAFRGHFTATVRGNERLLSYTTVTAVLIWVQVTLLLSRSPWWIIPVLPVLGLGLVAAFVVIGRWLPSLRTPTSWLALALVAAITVPSAIASVQLMQDTRSLQPGDITATLQTTEADLLIVDRGIAWSNKRFSDECISLHFGDFFAGGVAVREIAQRCPTISLVYSGADPNFTNVGPHDATITGRPPLSCQTVADQLERGSRVLLLVNGTPSLDNATITGLAAEDGWTLSLLENVICPT